METKEVLRLLLPLISIVMGVVIKYSDNPKFTPVKKYWLFFIIAGVLLFSFRLYKYLR
jgi:hypothetical protein